MERKQSREKARPRGPTFIVLGLLIVTMLATPTTAETGDSTEQPEPSDDTALSQDPTEPQPPSEPLVEDVGNFTNGGTFFEPNLGQFHEDVLFAVRGTTPTTFLTRAGAAFVLSENLPPFEPQAGDELVLSPTGNISHAAVFMEFEDGNPETIPVAQDPLIGTSSYFIGNDSTQWVSQVAHFRRVLYENVYPGINVIWKVAAEGAKFDFIVAPGADPDNIRLQFTGQDGLTSDSDGRLEIATPFGPILKDRPLTHQLGQEVDNRYVVDGTRVTFDVGLFDTTIPLTIDPLVYSTFIGGSSSESSAKVQLGSDGAAYVASMTESVDYPTTAGAYKTSLDGAWALGVSKLNAEGTSLVYSTYLGGTTKFALVRNLAVDATGNVFIVGYTEATDYPTTSGAFDRTHNGGYDGYVTKLNAAGSGLLFSTYLGGGAQDTLHGIAVNSNGNAFVTGATFSSNYPTTSGAYDRSLAGGGGADVVVTKLKADGSGLVYSTFIGGTSGESGNGIAIDSNGNAYIAGDTGGGGFPTTSGAYDRTVGGLKDVFLAKLSANGQSLLFSTFVGGSGYDYAYGVHVDNYGNAYIAGRTDSVDFPTTPGAYDVTHNGAEDAFVMKVNGQGSSLVYSTLLGGSAYDEARELAVDQNGTAYVAGWTHSTDFPTTGGGGVSSNGASFLARFNTLGSAMPFSTRVPGGLYGLAANPDGTVHISGTAESSGYPTTPGAYDTTYNGGWDTYVTKLDPNPLMPPENVAAACAEQGAVVSWSEVPRALVYKIYFGLSNPDNVVYVSNAETSWNHQPTWTTLPYDYQVSAWDASGEGLKSPAIAHAPCDLVHPTALDTPQDTTWTNQLPTLSGAQWQDTYSGLQNAATYSVGTGNGATDITNWTALPEQPVAGQMTAWQPTWVPSALAEGLNYINIRLQDRAGNALQTNGAYTVQFDSNGDAITAGPFASTGPGEAAIQEGVWQPDSTPYLKWNASESTSPIAGYSYLFSANASASPNESIDTTNTSVDLAGSPLDDGVWYFTVRALDEAGNAGPVASFGPLQVDATRTPGPLVQSATHPEQGVFYDATDFTVNWNASDATSGIQDYRYELRTEPCAFNLDGGALTTSEEASFPSLGPFSEYWFCVQARDNAGNWGSVQGHYFGVDAVAPTFPTYPTEEPRNGSASDEPFQAIRIAYHDFDGGDDTGAHTLIDVGAIEFIVDGIDIRETWESECGPGGLLYAVSCRLEVTDSGIIYEPPAAWLEGLHSIHVGIQDTTTAPNTATKTWSFVLNTTAFVESAGCDLQSPDGMVGNCTVLTPPRRLPANWLDAFEVLPGLNGTPADPAHDWDADGIPDILDPVNLPSESQVLIGADDAITLEQGIEPDGMLLLVEPSHHGAVLLIAGTEPTSETATSQDVLDLVEQRYGTSVRNALGGVLHDQMAIRLDTVLPNTPVLGHPLPWATGSFAADGSWLLIRTDPARSVQVQLGGQEAPITEPLASRISLEHEFRWEYINVHKGEAFCFDTAPVSACDEPLPGWIRAYSGQAAYALEASWLALRKGLIPLQAAATDGGTDDVSDALDALACDLCDATLEVVQEDALALVPGSTTSSNLDILDSDAIWHVPGDKSDAHASGIGIDYLSTVDGLVPGEALVQQFLVDQEPRLFFFQGALITIPGTPQDFTHLRLGIEPADGDHAGTLFVIDGQALQGLLQAPTPEYIIDFDPAHQDSTHHQEDINGDGVPDIIVQIAHFSAVWFDITHPSQYMRLNEVRATGSDTALAADEYSNRVYKITTDANGNLGANSYYTLFGSSSIKVLGLHAYSLDDFVASGEQCKIERWVGGSWSATWTLNAGGGNCRITDVWMNSAGTSGYAAAETGEWYEYKQGTWSIVWNYLTDGCGARDIEFDSNGNGYIAYKGTGTGTPDCHTQHGDDWGPIVYKGGTSYVSTEGGSNGPKQLMDIAGSHGGYAVGLGDSAGNHRVYRQGADGSWTHEITAPAGAYWGVAQDPSRTLAWLAGESAACSGCGVLSKHQNNAWTTYSSNFAGALRSVDMYSNTQGFAVGKNIILYHDSNSPPTATISSYTGTGTSLTDFQVQARGTDPDGGQLSYTLSWGDGSSTSGTMNSGTTLTFSHHYQRVGPFTITWTVTDPRGLQDVEARSISVNAISLAPGNQVTGRTLPAGHWHQFQITNSAGKAIQIGFTTPGSAILVADNGAPPTSTVNQWGAYDGMGLVGLVPNGKTLYVAVQGSNAATSYSLSPIVVDTPAAPVVVSAASPVLRSQAAVTASVVQDQGRPTALQVAWGDGSTDWSPAQGTLAQGSEHTLVHPYASRGSKSVILTGLDEWDRPGQTTTVPIVVMDAPAVTAHAPLDEQETSLTLAGSLDDLGADSSVSAWYELRQASTGALVGTSILYQRVSAGALPSWTPTGLTAATSYDFIVKAENDVAQHQSILRVQTIASTDAVPVVTNQVTSVTLGQTVSMDIRASLYEGHEVAYFVDWGDGSTEQLPTSYGSWDSIVSLSHVYAFPGDRDVEIRVVTDHGARGAAHQELVAITGSFVTISHDALVNGATLKALFGDVVPSSVQAQFRYRVQGAASWTELAWKTGTDNTVVPWTLSDLNWATSYEAVLDVKSGSATWQSPVYAFRANQPPTLQSVHDEATVSYLDPTRFEVLYTDPDGDAPASVTMNLGGQPYAMHEARSGGYASGVRFHYMFQPGELAAGTYAPTFQAESTGQFSSFVVGHSVTVKAAEVATHTFEQDAPNSVPQGFTKSSEQLNYWQVVDTSQPGFPDYAALGHGKVAWFGRPQSNDFNDPLGGTPRGALVTREYDLRTVLNPVFSFSSYFDTEETRPGMDVKVVEIRSKAPGGTWGPWQRLQTVAGDQGGFMKWRTQTHDLGSYASNFVQIQFRFDAGDEKGNDGLGWLIDDIGIGHDHDGDTLPDDLERQREDVRASRHVGPGQDGGGTAKSYVRRLVRPWATEIVLSSTISHQDPSDLKVWVGVEPGISHDGAKILVWDQGAQVGVCSVPSLMPGGFHLPAGRPVAKTSSSGIDVKLDFLSCGIQGSLFDHNLDWFIEVQDTQAGTPVIEALQIWTGGQTQPRSRDTDRDGRTDKDELLSGDPLGIDIDRDGLAEGQDPDPVTPTWTPAVEVTSFDYRNRFDIRVVDMISPVVSFRVEAPNDVGVMESLPLHPVAAGHWYILTPSWLPNQYVISWRDAYGMQGTLTFDMLVSESAYRPTDLVWRAEGPGVGSQDVTYNEMPAVAVGTLARFCVSGIGAPVCLVGILAVLGTVTQYSDNTGTATLTDDGGFAHRFTEKNTHVKPGMEIHVTVPEGVTSLSDAVLRDAIQNAEIRIPVDGAYRWIYEVGGTLVILITHGPDQHQVVREAWRWQLPPPGGLTTEPSLEELLALEKSIANQLGRDVKDEAEYMPLWSHARPEQDPCASRIRLTPFDSKLNDAGGDIILFVPCAVWQAWKEYLSGVKTSEKYIGGMSYVDNAVSQLAFEPTHELARRDQFPGEVYWFWDDDHPNAPLDCNVTPTPQVRRCVPHTYNGKVDDVTWRSFNLGVENGQIVVDDLLEFLRVKYPGASANLHTDVLSGKGAILDEQFLLADLQGKEPLKWYMDQLQFITTPMVDSQAEADVKVPYIVTDVAGGAAMMLFNEV